jgi:predicted Zn-dependent protease
MKRLRQGLLLLPALLLPVPGGTQNIDLNRLFSIGRDAVTAVAGVSEAEEIAMGREIAGRVLGAAPLVGDTALQAYVNRVGRWIALQSERPDLPWRFAVIDSPSINAFAAPGGHVLLTRGLYEILDTEAQLAGVLAHEIAHIVRRHHVTVLQKSAALSAGAQLAQRDNRAALINNMIGTGAEVFARGLDKSAEHEADAVGVVLAARAGYNPYGLVDVLHKLAVRGGNDGAMALLFKTHPLPGERLTQLGELLAPQVGRLPAGRDPAIRRAAAGAGALPAAAAPAALPAASAQPAEPQAPPAKGGVDPLQLLRGILGR